MYYDLGFNDWEFEIEETTGEQIENRLVYVCKNYDQSQEKVKNIMDNIETIYKKKY